MSAPLLPSKFTPVQPYQVLLYNRALHPELFQLKGRRVCKRNEYELEAWVMQGQHALRFGHRNCCACELLTDADKSPASGVVSAFLCAGERDFEHRFARDGVTYMTSVQTETLSDNLFLATHAELSDLARDNGALCHKWIESTGPCLSIIDVQQYNREIHVQCYHMLSNGGLVVRTQTLFEHK